MSERKTPGQRHPDRCARERGAVRYGLSLSACILDMAFGSRNPEDVIEIISGTDYDLNDVSVVDRIAADYTAPGGPWADASVRYRCEELFRRFVAEGKIQQPRRTIGYIPYIPGISSGRWVDSVDDIVWMRVPSPEGDAST